MRPGLLAAGLLAAASMAGASTAAAESRVWDFRAYLDGAPIGYHRFTLSDDGATRELKSETRFEVRVLLIPAYRYSHDATERWRGDCVERLTARTDDNGKRSNVNALREGERLTVTSARGLEVLDGCVMTFAYWNPRILRQSRLLNAQTGAYETTRIAALGEETINVHGARVMARRYRIDGAGSPIDLWYSANDEWLALESAVAGGRRLRYALD
jgi:Family of unknown function (DUF6134)